MLPEGAVTRLTVRAGPGDGAALRQAISRQIGSTDLRIPGLPPSGILLVRRLADPLPGRLSGHPAAVVADQRWQRALRARLEHLKERAARPRDGNVSEDAESLLFTDEAQLIACLACSALDRPGPPPWWRRAVAAYVPIGSMHALLGARVHLLPAVFSVLATWRSELRVAAALGESEAVGLAQRMADAFGLASWSAAVRLHAPVSQAHRATRAAAALEATETIQPAEHDPAAARESRMARSAARAMQDWPASAAPWEALWQPDAGMPLAPAREALIGLALTLHRAPSVARSRTFAARVAGWLQRTSGATVAAGSPRTPGSLTRRALSPAPSPWQRPAASELEVDRSGSTGARTARAQAPTATLAPASSAAARHDKPTTATASRQAGGDTAPHAGDAARAAHPSPDRPACQRQDHTQSADTADPSPASADGDLAVALREGGVSTELGGVLYLINLLVHLDLPQCFEASCGLASAVGAAGTLEALARALLPGLPPELTDDPLWSVLAELDRRAPGEPPRAQAMRCDELRLPVSWLEGTAEHLGALHWARRADHLVVWSDAGTRLLDVPIRETPARQLVAELSRYARAGLTRPAQRGLVRECPVADLEHLRALHWPDALLTWLEFVVPGVRHRLARALGKAPGENWDPLHDIARCPGRVFLTDTHLDLSASLQSISVALRLAGLDRSPGWVAGLGRVILFHFD
jgi:hypothetical protein